MRKMSSETLARGHSQGYQHRAKAQVQGFGLTPNCVHFSLPLARKLFFFFFKVNPLLSLSLRFILSIKSEREFQSRTMSPSPSLLVRQHPQGPLRKEGMPDSPAGFRDLRKPPPLSREPKKDGVEGEKLQG